MAKDFNQFSFTGNLGKDAESRFTPGGTMVSDLTVAVNDRVKKGEEWHDETDWFKLTLWRNDGLVPYLKKGTGVFVTGRIKNRSYEKDGEKKYVTDYIVDTIRIFGKANSGGSAPQQESPSSVVDDSDVPF